MSLAPLLPCFLLGVLGLGNFFRGTPCGAAQKQSRPVAQRQRTVMFFLVVTERCMFERPLERLQGHVDVVIF